MIASTADKLRKVRKYSASLRNFFIVLLVLGSVVWLILSIITVSEGLRPPVRIGITVYSGDSVSGTVRTIGYVFGTLSVVIALKLTFHLVKLFDLYADGRIFSAENVQQIRQIGITVLLFPALWVLGLFAPLLAPGEGVTSGALPLFIGTAQNAIFGTIVIVISWIMDVGRELREEQDLVV